MDFSILKNRRIELHLQQKEVADYVGVSPSTISMWEKGEVKSIKDQYIIRLSNILQLSPNFLINNNSEYKSFDYSNDDLIDICISSLTKPEIDLLSKGYDNWSDEDKRLLRLTVARFIYIGKHPHEFQELALDYNFKLKQLLTDL